MRKDDLEGEDRTSLNTRLLREKPLRFVLIEEAGKQTEIVSDRIGRGINSEPGSVETDLPGLDPVQRGFRKGFYFSHFFHRASADSAGATPRLKPDGAIRPPPELRCREGF